MDDQAWRHADDDRNATVTWRPATGADGYLVRFGDAQGRLYHSLQLQGGGVTSLVTHALNRGARAAWRVDAFNASGMAEGRTYQPQCRADWANASWTDLGATWTATTRVGRTTDHPPAGSTPRYDHRLCRGFGLWRPI